MKIYDNHIKSLDYKDVYIVPQYSEVVSRKFVETSSELFSGLKIDIPIISANMDSVSNGIVCKTIAEFGGVGALHRFMSIAENIKEYEIAIGENKKNPCLVSVGINEESKERARALYQNGARYFIIDIAHGDSAMMKNMLTWMRKEFSDIFIMAGNVATKFGATHLVEWGADSIKVGIGPGAVCLTKSITGTTVCQFTAVDECVKEIRTLEQIIGKKISIVADGGVVEIGDICKALGVGADFVMSGKLFAACKEAPGKRVDGKKTYRGSASKDVMLIARNDNQLPTPEGKSILLDESDESVADIVKHIKGGLQSAFSYSNAKNLIEFQKNCLFGIRYSS